MRTLKALMAAMLVASSVWAQSVANSQISGNVQDQTGSAIPGAAIRVTQTDTGMQRNAVSAADGGYIITSLPAGPYEMQVSKDGFSTFVQKGIVLQVGSNPSVNPVLAIGSVTSEVVVEAGATMVETQSTAIGQVIDQQRVVELPLNGRQATSLIFLAGAATTAPAGDLNTNKNYPTVTISVSGGLPNGMTYLLDGGTHNDPFNNLNLPIPFPDALQEFKVETSALPARYGQHASAAVNAITKNGTNQLHGDVFEFVRNYRFNARNFFAPSRDSLKRNQFGGVVGGPIIANKMFFFAGYQGTIERSNPPNTLTLVPTQAMRDGDFSGYMRDCAGGRNLNAPFVGNRIPASLINPQATNLLKFIPVPSDTCGNLRYGILNNNREHQIIGRIDLHRGASHTMYGRYYIGNYSNPVVWDKKNVLLANKTGVANQAQTFVLGDTRILSPTLVNSFHGTLIRTRNYRVMEQYFSPKDLGINVFSPIPGFMGLSITGGFNLGAGGTNPGYFNSTGYQFANDIDWIKGSHQFAFGVSYIRSIMNTQNNRPSNGQFTFSGQLTGLGYGDFITGNMSSFLQGNVVFDNQKAHYIGLYAQDSWKVRPGLQVNYGVRWEPFLPMSNTNGYASTFDMSRFVANQRSTAFPNAPAGLMFPGDPGFPGRSNVRGTNNQFAPRIGLVWDPEGKGRMTVRAAYGLFFDTPQLFFFTRVANNPPWGAQVNLSNPPGGFSDPYRGQPGGNPFPGGSFFPQAGVFVAAPLNMHATYLQQWNLSIQRQVGSGTLISATYLGNRGIHFWTGTELNPAVFSPGASLANLQARRYLNSLNPTQGAYFSTIGMVDDGGTQSYNGMLLSVQRRLEKNLSVLANWTWSHCISDPETTEITGPTYINPNNRRGDRSNCSSDRRHLFNLSMVANSPKMSNRILNMIGGGWQLSAIVRRSSGNFGTVTTGVDNALSGIGGQRPLQILESVYTDARTVDQYLNPRAFALPAPGTISPMRPLLISNPGQLIVDTGISRIFSIRENQKLHFRWEIFNLPNRLNANAPNTALNNAALFGRITTAGEPRIMQMALKYVF